MNRPVPASRRRLTLSLPWLVLAIAVSFVAFDNLKPREDARLEVAAEAVAVDPVCGMTVATRTARAASHAGRTWYFCSAPCRTRFRADAGRYAAAPASGGSHTMRGIPTWMYQAGVALVILLSFGLFERLTKKRLARASEPGPRWDLTASPGVRRALKWKPLVPLLRAATAVAFLGVIAVGLFGNQNPALNLAPLLTWTVWWAGLVVVVLFFGKAWCTVCPWDAIAGWTEKLAGGGLKLRWPAAARNIWFAVGLFLGLTWVELGMGITVIPRATAWVALGMLALAVGSALVFERKAFCQYGCLVGRVSGLYAMFGALEVRAKDREVCASCRTMDCYRGNENGDPCPTHQFLRVMDQNTYCTMCAECFKSCPHDNAALRLRPWAADMEEEGKPRADEAFLALALLSMTGFHGLTMTPRWAEWTGALQTTAGASYGVSFSVLMGAMLALPILLYAALVGISAKMAPEAGGRRLFLGYAYAMLPIALFYHLAHNAEHLLMEGPKLFALLSDPFGRGWNLLGTTGSVPAPWVSLEGLWGLQVLFVLIGHVYSLWISAKTTRRLVPDPKRGFAAQLPMLAAMVAFSVFSLWLLRQPMEMRVSAM